MHSQEPWSSTTTTPRRGCPGSHPRAPVERLTKRTQSDTPGTPRWDFRVLRTGVGRYIRKMGPAVGAYPGALSVAGLP